MSSRGYIGVQACEARQRSTMGAPWVSMREILVMTSRTIARTDSRAGGGETGQSLGTGVFG